MPTPTQNESRKNYISRCIRDVKGEYPEMDNEQAIAICYNKWQQGNKKNKGSK